MIKTIKTIYCIGDSLTEGDHGIKGKRCIANVTGDNYPMLLGQMLDCDVRNYGRSGYRPSDNLYWYQNDKVDFSDADLFIIMLGSNGGMHPTEDTDENKAYMALIRLFQKSAPNAVIALVTPPHATENPAYSNCGYAQQVNEAVLKIRSIAKKNNMLLWDLASTDIFTAQTEDLYQSNDGLHFNDLGYRRLAEYFADLIAKL